jgi:hypothetical protein
LKQQRVLLELPKDLTKPFLDHMKATGEVEGRGFSDFIYAPYAYVPRLRAVMQELVKREPVFFHEVSLPLTVNVVAPGEQQKYAMSTEGILWGRVRSNVTLVSSAVQRSLFIHPLKLAVPWMRVIWRDAMANQYKMLAQV